MMPHGADGVPAPRHRADHLALFVVLLCGGYLAALWWIDRGNGTFARLGAIWPLLALAVLPVSASYLFRFWRWRWLLQRQGHAVPFGLGWAAYLAGFALTATPGKAGELLRIRYFARMGVPAGRTLAVFVFERASDLLVILALSLLAAPVFPTLGTLVAVVLGFVALLFGAAAWPVLLAWLDSLGRRLPGRWLRRVAQFAVFAATELRACLGTDQCVRSLIAGTAAWGLTSAVFVGLCNGLGLQLEPIVAFGIYPLAMLIGALSFVPGGVGTTELAIVLMLNRLGVAPPDAIAVAVAARLVTLWYAVGVGALALCITEFLQRPPTR
ncbi:lysylphosphatidylglycerol synthase transmembrane domain-containing protein [Xanthomonas albilineans]|uniref:lysylphosphatidylglycerol synthase transmembrane domain-containing protein n=1 Tax=Xanthomonas albilineans TaxID=29447 RepID=UPI0005F3561F|nr:lysylphosphatidylglycerol synthase transmembrane domain-containing protein [Xanthomonas albilineans]PPU94129.1 lysylphosphatidylglycerol synthetase family protein [Xanthomonas albilineans]